MWVVKYRSGHSEALVRNVPKGNEMAAVREFHSRRDFRYTPVYGIFWVNGE